LTEQTVYIMKKRSCGEDLNAPGEIDVWEQVPEALQLRGFQAFRFDRQAIYSCLHTGVHRPLHTGVHDVCTRVCMAGCASHCP